MTSPKQSDDSHDILEDMKDAHEEQPGENPGKGKSEATDPEAETKGRGERPER